MLMVLLTEGGRSMHKLLNTEKTGLDRIGWGPEKAHRLASSRRETESWGVVDS